MRPTWLLILGISLGGCSGQADSAPPGPNRSNPAGGTGGSSRPGGGASGSSGLEVGTTPEACVPGSSFSSPLRRLTRLEYNNTIVELLGDTSAPADRFPADEVSGGFSNNAAVLSVSPLLAEKYQEAAEALAAKAVGNVAALVACDAIRTGEDACARQFVERFGRRAFRRPLAISEVDRLLALYTAARSGATFARGIEVVLRAVLQAPSFLYRLELTGSARSGENLVRLGPHELATRLSYLMWASMPDDKLALAADRGELATPAQLATVARAMLAEPRARKAVAELYRQWLGVGRLDGLTKDTAAYPDFTDDLRAGMRAELPAFVERLLWTGNRKLTTLLTSPTGLVTPALARLYGVPAPSGMGPQPVTLDAAQRAGVLTQAGVLAVNALPDQSSPIHRGKFVREQILCQVLPEQPASLMVTAPDVDPRPTRERFAQHAASPECAVCHRLMDPLGFGFESYDGIGRFRTMDGGRAVDVTGTVVASRDADGDFRGARELAVRLAGSAEVRDCVATQHYRFAFGHLEGPGDACSLASLRAAFVASGYDLRELLVALTQTEAFLYRPAITGGAP